MRVLVTGAAGFVGSAVVRAALARGHDVVAAVRARARAASLAGVSSDVRIVEADLADPRAMRRLAAGVAPGAAIHLAWAIGPDCWDAPENLACAGGSLALLRGLVEAGCPRIVFAGTHLELAPTDRDMAENDPVAPSNLYAVCKDAVHRVARAYVGGTGTAFVWTRLFNLYGPGQPDWAFVPYVVRHLLEGRRCPLTHGEQRRGFLHVQDAANALLDVAGSTVGGIVHVGSDEVVTVREVALRIGERLDRAGLLAFGALPPSPRDAPRIVTSTVRLRADVGFVPGVGLDDGLAATVDWWRTRDSTAAAP